MPRITTKKDYSKPLCLTRAQVDTWARSQGSTIKVPASGRGKRRRSWRSWPTTCWALGQGVRSTASAKTHPSRSSTSAPTCSIEHSTRNSAVKVSLKRRHFGNDPAGLRWHQDLELAPALRYNDAMENKALQFPPFWRDNGGWDDDDDNAGEVRAKTISLAEERRAAKDREELRRCYQEGERASQPTRRRLLHRHRWGTATHANCSRPCVI